MRAWGPLVLLCAAAAPCAGAGMNTHTMAGHRALHYYGKVLNSTQAARHNDAIRSNPDAVHAGADFPDFLYACGKYKNHHDAGEAAHWPPWQAAAVSYIRDRPDYKSGQWSDDTKKLIAFLYGVSVHYISDELWEGLNGQLGRGQGFVRFLSGFNLNHDGMSDNDEGVANMATDFFVSWAINEDEIKPWKRYFPINEIADIYHRFNSSCGQPNCQDFSDVTVTSLFECKLLFDLGLWAEKEFGQILFHTYSEMMNKVPMVSERVLDIPIGGIDDMAVWAAWVWERVARWLDNGTPAVTPPNSLRAQRGREGPKPGEHDEADQWLRDWIQGLAPLRHVAPALLRSSGADLLSRADSTDPSKGLVYHGPGELREAVDTLIKGLAQRLSRHGAGAEALRVVGTAQKPPVAPAAEAVASAALSSDEGDSAVGYLGSALAAGDFDGDGKADLAEGAYGTGVPGTPQVGRVHIKYGNGSTAVLDGATTHGRFGWELAVVDLNKDGVDDLAVSAPTTAWNKSAPMPDNSYPEMRVWGRVHVFYGAKGSGLGAVAATTLTTEDPLTALGMMLSTGDLDGDGSPDLLVGAPMSSFKADPNWADRDSIQRGALFALLAKPGRGGTVEARSGADLVIEGPAGYGWFGQSAAVTVSPAGRRLLLVGAPGYRGSNGTAGRVYAYAVNASGGRLQAAVALTLTGDEPLAEFGHAVAASAGNAANATVAIASPAARGQGGSKARGGEVRLLPAAAFDTLCNSSAPCDVKTGALPTRAVIGGGGSGKGVFGRLGWRLGYADVTGGPDADLVVAASLWSGGAVAPVLDAAQRERGRLYVWDGAKLPSGAAADDTAAWSQTGTRARARFGSAFAAVGGALAVGSPRADAGALEMAGAVDTFTLPR
eukprot:TRINITY_DN52_c0_g1_i1.p1 TRINITY_DN52_c0_g1~~TRINITY_DN52_c0_g1_i1.p1  ORF type:complete len:920 (+),score=309.51 TRINITY_DN52_c0_g1_i1:102-2762(+)